MTGKLVSGDVLAKRQRGNSRGGYPDSVPEWHKRNLVTLTAKLTAKQMDC